MSGGSNVNDLLAQHKEALNAYREWDEKVKHLLQGRRMQDLKPEDMNSYREAAEKRDAAYDDMRHLERQLLEDIPGAGTGTMPRIRPEDLSQKDTSDS
jgi:hypothetical protein